MTAANQPNRKGPGRIEEDVEAALAWLKRHGTRHTRDGMARYGIHADKAFGVSDGRHPEAGEEARAEPRARRRPLGHRLVRGPHADVVRRRAGARHARADGPLVPRLRQLGHLRHAVLSPVRPHAARLAGRSRSGPASATSSSSARHSRCWPVSPCTTSAAGDEPFIRVPAPHRARSRRRPELRQEGGELGAAIDREAQSGAQRGRGDARTAAGSLSGRHRAVGGQGRAQSSSRAPR